jgi:cytochrome o ubiquinol oxidase subunit 2
MPKRQKTGNGRVGWVIAVVVAYVALMAAVLLRGQNVALFNPKGWVAQEQMHLILWAVGIMLVIGIPVLTALYFVAWKYRESNTKAKRDPDAGHGKLINFTMWVAPGIIAAILAFVLIPATHKLDPKKVVAADAEPMTIQVIAQRWKWVFIYPEQDIATVNYVQIPVNTPVTFELTADEAPMSAFWIPNLGGMLYAMNGHMNRLNLIAGELGEYPGRTAELTGAGFAGMQFVANATSREDFDAWVKEVSLTSEVLNDKAYAELLKPSENHPETTYAVKDDNLYAKVLMKYVGAHDHQPAAHEGAH